MAEAGREPAAAPAQEPGVDDALQHIARGGVVNLIGSAVSAVVGLVVVVIITRFYEPSTAGWVFATTSAFLVTVSLAMFGADMGVVRFLPHEAARGRRVGLGLLARRVLLPVAVGALSITAVGLWLSGAIGDRIGGSGEGGTVIRLMACFVPVAALYEIVLSTTRGFGTMAPTLRIERLLRPVLQLALVLAAALLGASLDLLVLAWLLPYAVALLAAGAALVSLYRRENALPEAPLPSTEPTPAQFWGFSSARGVAAMLQAALLRADVVIVAVLAGPAAAAVYTAASRFLMLGQLAVAAIQQVVNPRLAGLMAGERIDPAAEVFRQLTVWITTLVWPFYIVTAIFGSWLLALFGSEFPTAASALAVLCLAMLVASAAGPLDSALLMGGRSGLSLINTAVALVVNIVLCFALIPPLGALGAAIAWAAAILARNLLAWLQLRRCYGFDGFGPGLAIAAAASLVSFGAIGLILRFALPPVPALLATLAVGGICYFKILGRFRSQLGLDRLARAMPHPRIPSASMRNRRAAALD